MKNLLLILFASLYINANAQSTAKLPVEESTKLITYNKVVEMPGVTKDSLFEKALAWCNTFFVNPTDVIREKDKDAGKIVCKARFKVMNPADKKGVVTEGGVVQYTLTINFRDGKYKYVMTEYNWKQPSYYAVEKWMDTANPYYKPEFAAYLQQVDDKSKEIATSLEKGMSMQSSKKKDDW